MSFGLKNGVVLVVFLLLGGFCFCLHFLCAVGSVGWVFCWSGCSLVEEGSGCACVGPVLGGGGALCLVEFRV